MSKVVDRDPPQGLAALEARLAEDLAYLNHPPAIWTPERKGPQDLPIVDVLIAGGGMNGLGAALALRRLGISRIRHVDAQDAGREGPWLTYARMEYLRSPKHLTGPAQGFSSLTFRAWWEAQYGANGWDELGYIQREDWARYLAWYGDVTGATVENRKRLTALRIENGYLDAHIEGPNGPERILARQLVLATGREGQASQRIPAAFEPYLHAGVQHSSAPLSIDGLAGRKVVVIGLSASAFDNASAAAEAGADVTLLGRAKHLPTVNKMKQTVYPGFAHGFPDLPDSERLAWLRIIAAARTAPPRHTVQRAARAGVKVVLDEETQVVKPEGETLMLTTRRSTYHADKVILGTGFSFDITADPLLAAISDDVLLWRDIGSALAQEDEYLDCPALGPGFELRSKGHSNAAALENIRCFTHAAQPSLGNLANDIPQSTEGAERLARAIAGKLFREDAAVHRERLSRYAELELLGEEIAFETS